jgi:hypothetical protein
MNPFGHHRCAWRELDVAAGVNQYEQILTTTSSAFLRSIQYLEGIQRTDKYIDRARMINNQEGIHLYGKVSPPTQSSSTLCSSPMQSF